MNSAFYLQFVECYDEVIGRELVSHDVVESRSDCKDVSVQGFQAGALDVLRNAIIVIIVAVLNINKVV